MGGRTSKGGVPESETGAGGLTEGQQATDGARTGGGGEEGVNNPSITVPTSGRALSNSSGDSGTAGTSPLPLNMSSRRRRVSVSAEVDNVVVKVSGEKKFVPKSEDTVKEVRAGGSCAV